MKLRAILLMVGAAAIIAMSACGKLSNPVSQQQIETEKTGVAMDGNLQFVVKLPGLIKAGKIVTGGDSAVISDTVMVEVLQEQVQALLEKLNELMQQQTQSAVQSEHLVVSVAQGQSDYGVSLTIDLTRGIAYGSVTVPKGNVIIQAFWYEEGRLVFQSKQVALFVEENRVYQIPLFMERVPAGQMVFDVSWDTTSVKLTEEKVDVSTAPSLSVGLAASSPVIGVSVRPGETVLQMIIEVAASNGAVPITGLTLERMGNSNSAIIESVMVLGDSGEVVGVRGKFTSDYSQCVNFPIPFMVGSAESRKLSVLVRVASNATLNQSIGLVLVGITTAKPIVLINQLPIYGEIFHLGDYYPEYGYDYGMGKG